MIAFQPGDSRAFCSSLIRLPAAIAIDPNTQTLIS
jgi:hypothetical protein